MDKAVVTTSWDDGHPLDLRLADMLQKYGVPATFYVPIDNVERQGMSPEEIRQIAQSFDIGGHTYHHINLTRVAPEEAEGEIIEGKKKLEDIVAREVPSFCYPYGKFNNRVINVVREAGFIGARTVRLLARSINDPFKTGALVMAKDMRPASFTMHLITSPDPGMFYFMLKNNLFFKGWDRLAVETLDFVIKNGGVWHLWGHSWEIDANNDWERLEEVLRTVGGLSRDVRKVDNSQLTQLFHDSGVQRERGKRAGGEARRY